MANFVTPYIREGNPVPVESARAAHAALHPGRPVRRSERPGVLEALQADLNDLRGQVQGLTARLTELAKESAQEGVDPHQFRIQGKVVAGLLEDVMHLQNQRAGLEPVITNADPGDETEDTRIIGPDQVKLLAAEQEGMKAGLEMTVKDLSRAQAALEGVRIGLPDNLNTRLARIEKALFGRDGDEDADAEDQAEAPAPKKGKVTPGERRKILHMAAQGLTAAQIADEVGRCVKTVRFYLPKKGED